MPAPQPLLDLVERFDRNREAYRSGRYNETQLRREFVDPLLKVLGWDIDNELGYAEAYKDVIHEDAIKIGGASKAPDYCLRIGGIRKFFVEAKKPSVNIKHDAHPAYQLRRYGWSSKLPVSVLTDFEEFAVYDCRLRPRPTDKPSTARILYLTYDQYPDRWEEIASVFSKEAVLTGAFDKFSQARTRRRGTAEVDEAFLAEIEAWRATLARHIATRNGLSARELNHAVQLIIDRIVFLRICEDRGIERAGSLLALTNGEGVYPRLLEKFRAADARYNSGLFHFEAEPGRADPDTLTPGLTLGDKPLSDILRNLYPPKSPYEFSVLPADILGQVYERFLGKVIGLSPSGKTAKVEEKPEVRKAGGVYYTPTYIVDYIVGQTVGKLLENRLLHLYKKKPPTTTPPRLDKPLRVLDPACGSGSFLLGAYQYLLDWHLARYVEHDAEAWAAKKFPPIMQRPRKAGSDDQLRIDFKNPRTGDWKLTARERKRILKEHVFGVDIDTQAVEVTKLSLLLKAIEGENAESLNAQTRLFQTAERTLPDLSTNIKCGNSLIGPDFYAGQQGRMFDEEAMYRINAFDWDTEFREIMKHGGFDAVIGNPPYVRMEAFKSLKDYLRERYAAHDERTDLYVYFIEKEHDLLRKDGRFGMIVSNKFLRANYGWKVRKLLAETATVEQIADFAGLPVFPGATVRTIVLITTKESDETHVKYSQPPDRESFQALESGSKTVGDVVAPIAYKIPRSALAADGWRLNRPEHAALLDRLRKQGKPLMEFMGGNVCMGIKSGLTKAFVITRDQKNAILTENPRAKEILHPFIQGRGIRRYRLEPSGEYLIYTYHGIDMSPYPAVIEHLRPFKARLEKRATRQAWYELQQPQLAYKPLLERSKIIFPDIATSCRFTLDTEGHFGANTMYFLPTADLRLLGLLNSRLGYFYFAQVCAALEGPGEAYLRFFGQYLEGFPVALTDPDDRPRHDRMVQLVDRMMGLHKRLKAARTAHERSVIERQVAATDREIDGLVYRLYGLSDEEIEIVEEASP